LAATQISRMYFDYNLLNMQSAGLPAVEFEHKLIKKTPKSVIFAVLVATNVPQALELEKRAKALPTVAGVESMIQFLAEDQTRKLLLVDEIKVDLANLRFLDPDRAEVRLSDLTSTLYSFYGYLGAAHDSVEKEDPKLAAMLAKARATVGEFRKNILDGDQARLDLHSRKLAAFQQALFNDLRQTFETLKNQDTSAPLRVQDLPPSLRDRFVGVSGKHLVMVYPREDVWQREPQARFIADLRGIDENVTGTPVQLYEYTTLLKKSYEQAAQYALIAIILMVLIHFRNLLSVVLALIPVGLGFLWLGGFMGYFGVPLNPANIMMLPLVIGIGVTNGIHILNRFAEEQTPSLFSRSTGKAVLISGLTSIAGFGSLALAQHRGIQSLGLVMGIGLTTCMIAGLTFLPALLTLLLRYQNANRPSDDNARSPLGREEPR
jgi:predicted RND superfamily exporter protein